jgi:hypothetical protein
MKNHYMNIFMDDLNIEKYKTRVTVDEMKSANVHTKIEDIES